MKTLFCLILIAFSLKSISQSKPEVSCWEAKTEYNDSCSSDRLYQLTISKDSAFIAIDNQYKYGYRIYEKKGKQYIKIGDEKFVIDRKKDRLRLNYADKKHRLSVNDIINVNFKKCNSR